MCFIINSWPIVDKIKHTDDWCVIELRVASL